jgi:hypothetical protein
MQGEIVRMEEAIGWMEGDQTGLEQVKGRLEQAVGDMRQRQEECLSEGKSYRQLLAALGQDNTTTESGIVGEKVNRKDLLTTLRNFKRQGQARSKHLLHLRVSQGYLTLRNAQELRDSEQSYQRYRQALMNNLRAQQDKQLRERRTMEIQAMAATDYSDVSIVALRKTMLALKFFQRMCRLKIKALIERNGSLEMQYERVRKEVTLEHPRELVRRFFNIESSYTSLLERIYDKEKETISLTF